MFYAISDTRELSISRNLNTLVYHYFH